MVTPLGTPQMPDYPGAPKHVEIVDVTPREAQQATGISLTVDETVELAAASVAAGITRLQVGLPGQRQRDREAAREIARSFGQVEVENVALVFLDAWREEVGSCLELDCARVNVVCRSSDRLQAASGLSRESALERVRAAVEAASGAARVSFTPSDATRTDPEYLFELFQIAAAAGADRIYLADSMGVAWPGLMANLVARACSELDIEVGVHCHDDLGLATANTLASIEAGATVVDVAWNGLGDRAGNAALEEIAVALEFVYGIRTTVELHELTPSSRRVAAAVGRDVAPNKAIVGRDVFSHSLPTHVAAMRRDGRAIQPFEAELVGNVGMLGDAVATGKT